jgi:hypothetical protein
MRLDRKAAPARELVERHFLDRSAAPRALEPGVVDNATVARIEPVVHVAAARCHEVRSWF